MNKPKAKPIGVKSKAAQVRYTAEIANLICDQLKEGKSLRQICSQPGMPDESSVREWAVDDYMGFAPHYAKARQIGYERLAEDILSIADEVDVETKLDGEDVRLDLSATAVARNRLRVDTRKWILSKVLPKMYGDKQTVELTGKIDIAGALGEARKRAGLKNDGK